MEYLRKIMTGRVGGMASCVLLVVCVLTQPAWGLGEERHGNDEMSLSSFTELNPVANHKSRVYAYWVNGHEGLFYRGSTESLNEVLQAFAAAPLEKHEVVLRPAPLSTNDFDQNDIPYDWSLDVIGGIASHMSTLDKGNRFWPVVPVLTIAVDNERIKLADLVIPESVSLVQEYDLRLRYLEGLDSRDQTVRGWGTGHLSRLNQFDTNDAEEVAKMLNDGEKWVRLNAAGSIANYKATAKPQLARLRSALERETADDVREKLSTAIDTIEAAEESPELVARHQALLRAIESFCRKQTTKQPD